MRMSCDAEGAIQAMQEGLKPSRPHTFAQADTIVRPLFGAFGPTSLSHFFCSLFLSSRGRCWDRKDTRRLQIHSSKSPS